MEPKYPERVDVMGRWGDTPLVNKVTEWLTREFRQEFLVPADKGKGRGKGKDKGKGKSKDPAGELVKKYGPWQQFVYVDEGGWADIRAVAYKADCSVTKLVCLAKALAKPDALCGRSQCSREASRGGPHSSQKKSLTMSPQRERCSKFHSS